MKLCPGHFESNIQKYIFVESIHTKLSAVQLSLMASIIYFVNQYRTDTISITKSCPIGNARKHLFSEAMDRILRERAIVMENYRLLRLSYPALPGVLRDIYSSFDNARFAYGAVARRPRQLDGDVRGGGDLGDNDAALADRQHFS